MITKIAFSSIYPEFNNEKILDEVFAKTIIGGSWLPILKKLLAVNSIELTTCDIAIKNIREKKWSSNSVAVIQDLNSPWAKELISLGAIPLILLCAESPIFAPEFYDSIKNVAKEFKIRVLFSGMFENIAENDSKVNVFMTFPSYSIEEFGKLGMSKNKKNLTYIASNKLVKNRSKLMAFKKISYFKNEVRYYLKRLFSGSFKNALRNELQTKRLEYIDFFGSRKFLDLYGKGWSNVSNLPFNWRRKLKKSLDICYKGECDNKTITMSEYRFALCFENVSYNGYITEKIIDCFVAGVIPIYCGAPDIIEFIPRNTFINMSEFETKEKLLSFITAMNEETCFSYIKNAKKFLSSKKGELFSYQGFAKNIYDLIMDAIDG